MNDNELRQQLKSSPEVAHRLLFDEYYKYVYTIVFNKLRSVAREEDIEECISDVFADIFMSYDSESEYSGDLKGYIATIATRKSINMFKSLAVKQGRTVPLEEYMNTEDSENKVDEKIEKTQMRKIILDEIEKLGEPDSTIIMQKFYYNNNASEIAKIISMKPAAIRQRCGRAMKILQQRFQTLGISL